jgi:lincosamide nucleotidyltransferase A/C/D/E
MDKPRTPAPAVAAPEMSASDALALFQLMQQNGIDVCLDGGWAVDALLGEQTRRHSDLDIAIPHKDSAPLRRLLEARGFSEVPRDDSWECNYVLGDASGRQVDIHTCTFDAEGRHVFGVAYPFDSLKGSGSILGSAVKCITPEWLVKFHSGYRLDEDDYRDVRALCRRFKIALPAEYAPFENKGSP